MFFKRDGERAYRDLVSSAYGADQILEAPTRPPSFASSILPRLSQSAPSLPSLIYRCLPPETHASRIITKLLTIPVRGAVRGGRPFLSVPSRSPGARNREWQRAIEAPLSGQRSARERGSEEEEAKEEEEEAEQEEEEEEEEEERLSAE